MSQAPNNPFDNPPEHEQQRQSGSNTWLWVLGILGGLFLLTALICCGAIYFGSQRIGGFIAETAVEEFRDDPVIQEHIGEITSSNVNFGEAIKQASEEGDSGSMVFDVSGDKGSGKIIIRTDNQNQNSAVLQMDDGTEYDLDLPQSLGGGADAATDAQETPPTGETEATEETEATGETEAGDPAEDAADADETPVPAGTSQENP